MFKSGGLNIAKAGELPGNKHRVKTIQACKNPDQHQPHAPQADIYLNL